MTTVAFIGLGHMGLPMARNLLAKGFQVVAYDVAADAVAAAVADGAVAASDAADAAATAEVVITMLPNGQLVRDVYLGAGGVIAAVRPGTLLIDSSTIDVATAREVGASAADAGLDFLDAPVSGGVGGAAAGTLTFMVGGSDQAFARCQSVLSAMARAMIHAGGPGNGQAAKICNNMVLGVTMIGVCEAFVLGRRLGLDDQTLFDIASQSTASSWSLNSYCPVPGPVPTSPANRDYQGGFSAALMLKDLRLAQAAATAAGAVTPMGAQATALYDQMNAAGLGGLDFSAMFKMLQDHA